MLYNSRVLFCSTFCDTYPIEHSVTNHTYKIRSYLDSLISEHFDAISSTSIKSVSWLVDLTDLAFSSLDNLSSEDSCNLRALKSVFIFSSMINVSS